MKALEELVFGAWGESGLRPGGRAIPVWADVLHSASQQASHLGLETLGPQNLAASNKIPFGELGCPGQKVPKAGTAQQQLGAGGWPGHRHTDTP